MKQKTIQNLWLTGFGLGKIPWAPGTFGSLLAIAIYFATKDIWPFIQVFLAVAYFVISLLFLKNATKIYENIDHPSFVCDEIIALWLVYIIFSPTNFFDYAAGFVLFRIFDIWKPYPIKLVDKQMKNALGVILDDILAGVYTLLSWIFLSFVIEKFGDKFV